MPKIKHTNLFILLIALQTTVAHSATSDSISDQPWLLNLYFENDVFGPYDRDYTNGIRASWISPDISSYEDDQRLPQWLRSVNKKLTFFHEQSVLQRCAPVSSQSSNDDCLRRNLVVSLGQLMYTPRDDTASELLVNERPYAGYLYSSFAYHTRSDDILDTIELSLGVVGPMALAEKTQDFIHDLKGVARFQGWDNQLNNELGINALYEHKRRVLADENLATVLDMSLSGDLITHTGFALGNIGSYFNAGFELRFGFALPDDFGTASVRPGGDNGAPGRKDPRLNPNFASSAHFFVAMDGRYVMRDIFLDGNSFSSSHSIPKKRWVGDIAAGINIIVKRWRFSYAHRFRSREYDGQPNIHEYGSLTISYVL